MCGNPVHHFRPDVTRHDNGRDVPGKGRAQGINRVKAVGRSAKIVIAYQQVGTDFLPADPSQRVIRRCNHDRLYASRFQQAS